ncbi:hypothetical protein [Kingella sp. (in: b-proteobacteria)]|uniref:hypothetical protein n=1 Tax=Kingella sp. (in: b-proteobacteria) TaxID=2020713 RepID=UPI0026DB2FDF|nr:hypothetical protein [Kingella sp. (in: b-proteobacteria)]MDO4658146.1 hypothetical protein [Kingella sp. (in: b-proteobacteria)]
MGWIVLEWVFRLHQMVRQPENVLRCGWAMCCCCAVYLYFQAAFAHGGIRQPEKG